MGEIEMERIESHRLFETKGRKGRAWWWLYGASVLLGLLLICVYRLSHVPVAGQKGRWAWVAMFVAELFFAFYWILTFSVRWNPIHRYTFKDRLSHRYEDKLPRVDVFICTADPIIEPPIIVINTVLSALAYDYPPEKLSVYLSDDGGSIFTFYALLEASRFAKSWIPFSKKFNVQQMSPALLFSKSSIQGNDSIFLEWIAMELRVSEQISNGSIILINDCDMCANNVESIRDALCIFMDEETGHEYAFVQFPQKYYNITRHDLYASSLTKAMNVEFLGLDGQGGPLYIGSCCFHRRDCLNGRKYNELSNIELKWERPHIIEASTSVLEEITKNLATCDYSMGKRDGFDLWMSSRRCDHWTVNSMSWMEISILIS